MAKKRKKEKEEKVVFKPPEFDEVKFMQDEILAAKVGFAAAAFAIPLAGASYGLTLAGLPIIAFFVGLGGLFLMRPYFELLGFETSEWERKSWAGHGAAYFFTWLAVWVLLVNAPFTDLVGPSIQRVTVSNPEMADTESVGRNDQVLANVTTTDSPLTIEAWIGDNQALDPGSVRLSIGGQPGLPMSPVGAHTYRYAITNYTLGTRMSITLSASDQAGHTSEFSFTLTAT